MKAAKFAFTLWGVKPDFFYLSPAGEVGSRSGPGEGFLRMTETPEALIPTLSPSKVGYIRLRSLDSAGLGWTQFGWEKEKKPVPVRI